jgi:aldehyde dehydrogenase (NAD+)
VAETSTLIEQHVDLFIDGESRPASGDERIDVRDPATDQVLTHVAAAQEQDVQAAIDAARRAQPGWAELPPRERGRLLYRLAERIRADADRLAHLESSDTGKPLRQARADVDVAAQYFEFYAGYADKLYGDTIPLDGSSFALTFREPLGVTGHIIPWNYPIQICSRTIAPALMVGNACVVKPAEEAPLAAVLLARMATEAGFPRGVLNMVPGLGEVAGAYLSSSDEIDHVSFTGGVDTGRLVMAAAARNVKPVTMELGGKSPSIVLADADLDRAAPVITNALIQNAGQTCAAGTRVIVHRSRHDELVDRLSKRFRAVRVGRGTDDPDMGPLISAVQRDRVLGYLDIARDEGAVVLAGGSAPDGDEHRNGYFVAPTLLDGVRPEMRVAHEEIFGPVLSVLTFEDEAEAAQIADATAYGLVTSVWTTNVDRALWLARHVKSGQVYVNSYGAGGGVPLPFGGYKKSGFGREKGLEAVYEYSQTKTIAFDVQVPR